MGRPWRGRDDTVDECPPDSHEHRDGGALSHSQQLSVHTTVTQYELYERMCHRGRDHVGVAIAVDWRVRYPSTEEVADKGTPYEPS